MADDVDAANDSIEVMMKAKIEHIQNQGRELDPSGECHWCEEPFDVPTLKLFCGTECSKDYERNKHARKLL